MNVTIRNQNWSQPTLKKGDSSIKAQK